jgi:peroxiredoxin Q/BCP
MALSVGDPAPTFEAPATGGETISLESMRGKWVVLYFYPKADTPGCTRQSCSLRDGYQDIMAAGAIVLGVSRDTVDAQEAFKKKYNLPFPLIADADGTVAPAYGVLPKLVPLAKRKTFIIDPDGKIAHVFSKVDVARHNDEVLAVLDRLRQERAK